VQEPPASPPDDDEPPPDGTPPSVPSGAVPPSAGTAPVDPATSPPVPGAAGEAETSQNALDWPASYGPANWARPSFTHGFPGSVFTPQPDGTLRCPAGHPLFVQERRPERNGSLRVLYAARIGHCRPCPLREQCQESGTTLKPRRVSAVFWPRPAPPVTSPPAGAAPVSEADQASPPAEQVPASSPVPAQPVRWGDWPRCQIRRTFVQLLRTQAVLISVGATETLVHAKPHCPPLETRAERARFSPLLGRTARPQCSPSHRPSGGNCSSWASCTVHSGVRLPSQTRRLIHSFASSVRHPLVKLTKEKRECGRIEGMRRPLFLLISSSKTNETRENPRVKLSS
jgi:hypothetical protein